MGRDRSKSRKKSDPKPAAQRRDSASESSRDDSPAAGASSDDAVTEPTLAAGSEDDANFAESDHVGSGAETAADEASEKKGEDADRKEPSKKSEVKKGKAARLEGDEAREMLETSASGAPAVGEAVRDLFGSDEIFHRILATADSEFSRSNRILFLSGLMAGLAIGLTFLARVAFAGALGEDPTGFLENAFYPIGFVFIIIGRQQLFTENTLTPVSLTLMRLSSVPRLLELWCIVYLANIVGAVLMGLLFSSSDILTPEAVEAAMRFGEEGMSLSWGSLFVRGSLAGFMVAGMVWLLHAVREAVARLMLVYLIFFLIPSTGLFHCIIGACEITYFTLEGGTSAWSAIADFQLPITFGNAIGGVIFVAIPNFFQTAGHRFEEWEKLGWREWLFGYRELAARPEEEKEGEGEEEEEEEGEGGVDGLGSV